jgi:hypothetical protein
MFLSGVLSPASLTIPLSTGRPASFKSPAKLDTRNTQLDFGNHPVIWFHPATLARF